NGSDTSVAIGSDMPTGSSNNDSSNNGGESDVQMHTPGMSWEILPLVGKAHATFVDLLTVGRTAGNDIVIPDLSVSRSHAFLRRRDDAWFLCDAGSKNGTQVDENPLQARTEVRLVDNSRLRFGGVEFCFCGANALFDLLSGASSQERESTLSNRPLS
ncbi:MAG: FHA domain-containing protein, partial [Kofleriaceae bacterium]|nr:FHA domain-containing protein [Kofleriaceae bacterium]